MRRMNFLRGPLPDIVTTVNGATPAGQWGALGPRHGQLPTIYFTTPHIDDKSASRGSDTGSRRMGGPSCGLLRYFSIDREERRPMRRARFQYCGSILITEVAPVARLMKPP